MKTEPQSRKIVIITAVFAELCGLYLLAAGIWLAISGGSVYYIIAGITMLLVAILVWRRLAAALWLYALLLLCTMAWAVWEVGFDFWALTPRCDVLVFFGIWLCLPFVYRRLLVPANLARPALATSLLVTAAVLVFAVFNDPQEINGRLADAPSAVAPAVNASTIAPGDWPAYGRTQAGERYSPLNQITNQNVNRLKVAWTFRTGDLKGPNDPVEITDEVTPIKVGDMLYLCTPHQIIYALDAATGKEKWKFDPQLKTDPTFQHVTCRGVSYHEMPVAKGGAGETVARDCPRRILLPVNNGKLYALDALTGTRCASFADNGELNLQANMPVTTAGEYEPTSPPIVTDKVIVIAGAVTDNYSTHEPSGVIRGFDVITGKLLWAFDPGNANPNAMPAEDGQYVPNSPNSWAPAAYDAQLDIVYLPMGVATPDIWGGNRSADMERYASGLLALNATTGKLAWFYQTVHHDLWDMDLPAQPTLVDITNKQGEKVPAVYAPAKTGNIFVLDRRTGKPIVPAPERPVPQGPAEGDRLSPTQPFSDLTFRPAKNLSGADMWGATMFDQLVCRIMFQKLRYEGIFTPPSVQGTLVFPGNLGMFEWGGISVDPNRQIAVANPMALPFVSRLIPRGPHNPEQPDEGKSSSSGSEAGLQPQYGVPFGVTLEPFLSPFGLPCKQPAWGYIAALDLKTHEIAWKHRIGTVRDSSPIPLPFKMGMPMLGAPITTAGNLIFITGTADNYIRAFDVTTGEPLWSDRLPAGGQSTPMTYEAGGKQYVVTAAGGHGSFGTKLGDYIIAYALPE